jgi:haloalkane dehalogenase
MPITVLNAPTHLIDTGAGAPALLLHGVPDSGELWRGVLGQLPPGIRAIAPDLPGLGQSGVPQGFNFSLDAMARWVEALVDALGIAEPLHLVGHDFGGIYGMAWAVRSPARVRSITVTNTNFFSDYRWHSGAQLWRTPILGELATIATPRSVWRSTLNKISPALPADLVDAGYNSFRNATSRRTILRLYRATDSANFRGWEDGLLTLMRQAPSMVLWGDKDPFAPSAWAEKFQARATHHFADYGHWLPAEAPAPFAARLAELWGSTSAD